MCPSTTFNQIRHQNVKVSGLRVHFHWKDMKIPKTNCSCNVKQFDIDWL